MSGILFDGLTAWLGAMVALYLTLRFRRREVARLQRRIDQLETAEVVVRLDPLGSQMRVMVQDLELLERWRPGFDPDTAVYPDLRLVVRLAPLP